MFKGNLTHQYLIKISQAIGFIKKQMEGTLKNCENAIKVITHYILYSIFLEYILQRGSERNYSRNNFY